MKKKMEKKNVVQPVCFMFAVFSIKEKISLWFISFSFRSFFMFELFSPLMSPLRRCCVLFLVVIPVLVLCASSLDNTE